MRPGLDFVDLHNPQIRRRPVRLEQWIVIGTEMSGYTLPPKEAILFDQIGERLSFPVIQPTGDA
jgi:hypothetical protein